MKPTVRLWGVVSTTARRVGYFFTDKYLGIKDFFLIFHITDMFFSKDIA